MDFFTWREEKVYILGCFYGLSDFYQNFFEASYFFWRVTLFFEIFLLEEMKKFFFQVLFMRFLIFIKIFFFYQKLFFSYFIFRNSLFKTVTHFFGIFLKEEREMFYNLLFLGFLNSIKIFLKFLFSSYFFRNSPVFGEWTTFFGIFFYIERVESLFFSCFYGFSDFYQNLFKNSFFRRVTHIFRIFFKARKEKVYFAICFLGFLNFIKIFSKLPFFLPIFFLNIPFSEEWPIFFGISFTGREGNVFFRLFLCLIKICLKLPFSSYSLFRNFLFKRVYHYFRIFFKGRKGILQFVHLGFLNFSNILKLPCFFIFPF